MSCTFRGKILIILSLWICFPVYVCSQDNLNYSEIFGKAWQEATETEQENRQWMDSVLSEYGIPYPLAIAIVFPELVRYSAVKDRMEVALLKALFINLGDEYADFSIGIFQMKPSFAITVRQQSREIIGKNTFSIISPGPGTEDIRDLRKQIVAELEDPRSQLAYLVSFIKLCEKKYRLRRLNDTEMVKFLSTAYNCGIDRTKAGIDSMITKRFFSTKLFSSETYPYSEVSMFWYTQNKGVGTGH